MDNFCTGPNIASRRWARRKASLVGGRAIVNQYQMDDDMTGLRVKRFPDDLAEWIDFVCNCRDGKPDYQDYDLIIGKVANDKVFRVVDMYHSGIWDKERALKEIREVSFHKVGERGHRLWRVLCRNRHFRHWRSWRRC